MSPAREPTARELEIAALLIERGGAPVGPELVHDLSDRIGAAAIDDDAIDRALAQRRAEVIAERS